MDQIKRAGYKKLRVDLRPALCFHEGRFTIGSHERHAMISLPLERSLSLTLFGVALIALSAPAKAAGLTQTHPLDFGTVTIVDFSTVGTLVLGADGNYVASPEIVVITPPTPATFEATGFSPNTAGTISVTDGTATEGGNGTGETLIFTDYTNDPTTIMTDGSGSFIFDLGATMSTEGDGGTYVSGVYSGTITVTVTF